MKFRLQINSVYRGVNRKFLYFSSSNIQLAIPPSKKASAIVIKNKYRPILPALGRKYRRTVREVLEIELGMKIWNLSFLLAANYANGFLCSLGLDKRRKTAQRKKFHRIFLTETWNSVYWEWVSHRERRKTLIWETLQKAHENLWKAWIC